MQSDSTKEPFVRRKRELQTIEVMIGMYCSGHHCQCRQGRSRALCRDCMVLLDYAERRLERCVFGDVKPTCAKCVVHCYSAEKREQIRAVMQWAGPRMLLRHPLRAMFHLLEGRRSAPILPVKPVTHKVQITSDSSSVE